VNELLGRLWHWSAPLQGWLLWLAHAKFTCGVTGVVRAPDGRVLLLRHRFWAPDMAWGFPSGCGLDGLALDDREILQARLFDVARLPVHMPATHRELAAAAPGGAYRP
jgi:hypothetical protein